MPHAFVTGGTGFVGINLIRRLIGDGWKVTALHRPGSRLAALEDLAEGALQRVVGDVTDAESVHRAMPDRPDAVFHVAASLSFWSRNNDEQQRVNVDGTRSVVDAALARRARRLVHTSSIAAFGVHDYPIDESTSENASRSWIGYLRTKALAEVEVRRGVERGLDATIVNPSNIMGPYDRTGWAGVIRQIDAGRFPGSPPGRASFCHVDEVVGAHVRAVERGGTGENYLLGGTEASYLEMAQVAAALCGKPAPRRTLSPLLLRLLARLSVAVAAVTGKTPLLTPELASLASAQMVCRSDKAERVLGYRPVALRAMMTDSHRWLAANGLLRQRDRGADAGGP